MPSWTPEFMRDIHVLLVSTNILLVALVAYLASRRPPSR